MTKTANNALERSGGHRGRTVLAMNCVLAGCGSGAVAGRSTRSLDLTEMASQQEQFRELEKIARLRILRNTAFAIGSGSFLLSLTAAGFIQVADPKVWSSLFIAMGGEGLFRWAVVPLMAAGLALIFAGSYLHGLLQRKYGEV